MSVIIVGGEDEVEEDDRCTIEFANLKKGTKNG